MKLQKEFEFVKDQFQNNLEKIKEYAPQLKTSGQYKDFEVRLTWDCIRAFVGSGTVCYGMRNTIVTILMLQQSEKRH